VADCIFCRIAAGEVPVRKVDETDRALAFHDTHPQAPIHLLLIPKQHLDSAAAVRAEHGDLMAELFGLAARVAAKEGLTGWRMVTNVGPEAGQSVMHLHFHLLGGRAMRWPPG
jgi:histidine triad (HIT) family protein